MPLTESITMPNVVAPPPRADRRISTSSVAAVTIESLTPANEGEWSNFVAGHPRATFFHELSYRRAVERAYGHRAIYLLARRGEAVCGVLPLFCVRSRLAGTLLVSVPYGIHGGPLAEDAAAEAALRCAAEAAAGERRAGVVEWRSAGIGDQCPVPSAQCPEVGEPRGVIEPQFSKGQVARCASADVKDKGRLESGGWRRVDRYVTFRRELPATPDGVAAWLPRKARAAARRAAERNDLSVSWDDAELPLVWELYSRSMRRLGSINYTRAFFEALIDETPGDHLVQIVRCGGRPVAGLLTFLHRRTAMPYFVGVDERADVYGLNNFLYFRVMQKAVELGCRVFDFGRSRIDNTGSFEFKRLHGFEPQPLAYERFVAAGHRDTPLTPSNPRFALARRVWPHLPLSVTRRVGGWLSRSIPG